MAQFQIKFQGNQKLLVTANEDGTVVLKGEIIPLCLTQQWTMSNNGRLMNAGGRIYMTDQAPTLSEPKPVKMGLLQPGIGETQSFTFSNGMYTSGIGNVLAAFNPQPTIGSTVYTEKAVGNASEMWTGPPS